MSNAAVQQTSVQNHQVAMAESQDAADVSPLDLIFTEGSLTNTANMKSMATELLKLHSQSPFLSEEQVQELESIIDGLDSDSLGDQVMAVDRLTTLLIEIHPGDSIEDGVNLTDLTALKEEVSPLAEGYRTFLESALNQASPAKQLEALQDFANMLQDLDSATANQLGLSGNELKTFTAEVSELVSAYQSILNTESAALVSEGVSWESFVGRVQDLKSSLEGMGLNLEGSVIDGFLMQYGSSESMNEMGQMDLLAQRAVVVSFRSDLLNEVEISGVEETFVPQGVNKAQEQVKIEENIYAVGEMIAQDEYREYLTAAKSGLMEDGGSLAGASAKDFELYKSNLKAIADRRCDELGIPSDPAYRSPAQQELAESDILLAMVDGSMAWASKWEAEAGSGHLTKSEALAASIELVALDASTFKEIQQHVATTHGTDSEIYMIVTTWFETAIEILLKVKDTMKMAAAN